MDDSDLMIATVSNSIETIKDLLDPRKKELKNVRRLVKQDPTYVRELISVIADGLDDFKSTCEATRDELSYSAISALIDLLCNYKKLDKIKRPSEKVWFCVNTVDTLLYKYPNGFPFNGSTNDKHFVNTFCTFYFNKDTDLHNSLWEKETKNCHEYMNMLYDTWIQYIAKENEK